MTGFCKEEVIFTAHAAQQKYQNLYQLFFWSIIVSMAFLFYLPGHTPPAGASGILVTHKTINSVL
jgi:hypothetical protein